MHPPFLVASTVADLVSASAVPILSVGVVLLVDRADLPSALFLPSDVRCLRQFECCLFWFHVYRRGEKRV